MKSKATVCTVALLWLLLAVAGWILPDGEMSLSERRPLEQLPELTAEGVFSGDYFQDLEQYLLDQFPIRDQTIQTVNRLESLLSFASHDDYLLIAEDVEFRKLMLFVLRLTQAQKVSQRLRATLPMHRILWMHLSEHRTAWMKAKFRQKAEFCLLHPHFITV